jgi:hypothetical protein
MVCYVKRTPSNNLNEYITERKHGANNQLAKDTGIPVVANIHAYSISFPVGD